MNKQKIVVVALLTLLIISVGTITVALGQPTYESKVVRIVQVSEDASQKVGNLIDLVYANETALEKIDVEGLTAAFEGNVSLYYEGVDKVTIANNLREIGDFEGARGNATEALFIFREVYKSINLILWTSEIRITKVIDVDVLEEAIERSQERVDELKELISVDSPIFEKLIEAENYLKEANESLSVNIEDSKASLRQANSLISEVCTYLKELAQELNSQRIWDYCQDAYRYRERFRERFGQASNEGFDVNGFLQDLGYANEEDFLSRFQEMIQKAQEYKNVEDALEDLEEIGKLIREMGSNFTQEMGRFRAQHGQLGSANSVDENLGGFGQQNYFGSGLGQNAGSYGGYAGSGSVGFGGNR